MLFLTDFALFTAPSVEGDASPTEDGSDNDADAETQVEGGTTVDVDTDAETGSTPAAATDAETESTPTVDADAEAQTESASTDDASVEGETENTDTDDPWTRIHVVHAWADHEQALGENNLEGVVANAIDDKPETGWALDRQSENRQAIFLAAAPFGMEGGNRLKVRLKHEYDLRHKQLGRFRLALTDTTTIYPIGSKITLGDWHSQQVHLLLNTAISPSTMPTNLKRKTLTQAIHLR